MRAIGIRLAVTAVLFVGSAVAVGQVWDFGTFFGTSSPAMQPLAVAVSQSPTTTVPTNSVAPTTTGPPPSGASPTTTAAPTTAPPSTSVPSSGPVLDHQRRGEEALAKISYPWEEQLPDWTIEFRPSRSGVLGYTYTSEQRIEVYVRDSMSEDLLAHVIAHEIGHAVDVSLNSGDERRQWLAARELGDTAWWPEEGGVSDFNSGAGDFAEGFAAWQVGTGSYRSKLGPAPNSAQLELIAKLANN